LHYGRGAASTGDGFGYFADHIGALILGCDYCDHRPGSAMSAMLTRRYSAFDSALERKFDWWGGELALFGPRQAEDLTMTDQQRAAVRWLRRYQCWHHEQRSSALP
jgi:hypothetical protein